VAEARTRFTLFAGLALLAGTAAGLLLDALEKADLISRVGEKGGHLAIWVLIFVASYFYVFPYLYTRSSWWAGFAGLALMTARRTLDFTEEVDGLMGVFLLEDGTWNYAMQRAFGFAGVAALYASLMWIDSGDAKERDAVPPGADSEPSYSRLLLIATIATILFGAFSSGLDMAGRFGVLDEAVEDLIDLLISVVICVAAMVAVRDTLRGSAAGKWLLAPVGLWMCNRLLNYTEEFPQLDLVPILGEHGFGHNLFLALFGVAGGVALFAALYVLAREREQAEERLGAERGKAERAVAAYERSEEALRRSQRLESLGVMAGGVAHDFNNLLTVVGGYLELAASKLPPGHPAQQDLEHAQAGTARAGELANQLLTYSGRTRRTLEAVELNAALRSMDSLVSVTVGKTAEFHAALAETPVWIDVDPTQLRQVVLNLLSNASDALDGRSGRITLRTRTVDLDQDRLNRLSQPLDAVPGRFAAIEVSDTGCGLIPGTEEAVFDPFFTTKTSGRGLGLAAVLGVLRGHGGAIDLLATPGVGAEFRVYFPLSGQASPTPGRSDPGFSQWQGDGQALVVDDEHAVRLIARMALEAAGMKVAEAADGREALELITQGISFDVVVLDVVMPGLGGEATLEAIRRLDRELPVLLVSGFGADRVSIEHDQATGFLRKPFTPKSLRRALLELAPELQSDRAPG